MNDHTPPPQVSAAGAQILAGLHETDYGSRDFAVRDPEGNRIQFIWHPPIADT